MNKAILRKEVQDNLESIVKELNEVLLGTNINAFEPTLKRLGRGKTPHWFELLKADGALPNLDGKTIGSVIEMLFVSVLEKHLVAKKLIQQLSINPARGIDIPDLNLGIKSPSENYATSEPFFSAYERILGNEHDAVILLTNYQTAKNSPPLKISIIKAVYLKGSEIADKNLCAIGKEHREWLLEKNEIWAKKYFRFLAYVNQSDWCAKQLLNIVKVINDDVEIQKSVDAAKEDFAKQNVNRAKENKDALPPSDLEKILAITGVSPLHLGVITAIDDWVAEEHKDFGRLPNDNEWDRIKISPLDGKIGMSFALQWRYNFKSIFS